jgi:hypothetical protein
MIQPRSTLSIRLGRSPMHCESSVDSFTSECFVLTPLMMHGNRPIAVREWEMNRLSLRFLVFLRFRKALCREQIELPRTCVAVGYSRRRLVTSKFLSRREDVHKFKVPRPALCGRSCRALLISTRRHVTATFGASIFTAE